MNIKRTDLEKNGSKNTMGFNAVNVVTQFLKKIDMYIIMTYKLTDISGNKLLRDV